MGRRSLMLVPLLLLLCVSSCGEALSPWARMEELTKNKTLPYGVFYRSDAEEGSASYFSQDMAISLYGEDAPDVLARAAESFCIFLSSHAEPYEIAVLLATSHTSAKELLALCLYRREALSILLRHTPMEQRVQQAQIYREGRFVIMLLTDGMPTP